MGNRFLTDRQAEFVRLTCAGRSLREVTAAMDVEVVTVRALSCGVRRRPKTHPITETCRTVEFDESPP
jgi:hypothetical protein